jgi:hypothetical protein
LFVERKLRVACTQWSDLPERDQRLCAKSLNRVDGRRFDSVRQLFHFLVDFRKRLVCFVGARALATIRAATISGGYSVVVDVPFAGALVPLSSYQKDRRILSVMIEVNRHLYMDERTGQKRDDFETVRGTLGRLIVAAAEAAVGGGRSIASGRRHSAAQIVEIVAALDHRRQKPNEKRFAITAQINWAKERR